MEKKPTNPRDPLGSTLTPPQVPYGSGHTTPRDPAGDNPQAPEEESLTYEQALERLERLTREMEVGDIGIDRLAESLEEARRLLAYCRERLTQAEKSCSSLLSQEGKD